MTELEEVKRGYREDNAGLAQTPQQEINLVRKIENNMKNLLQSLNSIESLTNGLNKNLLPQLPKAESEAKAEVRQPQGWLENHLVDIETALRRSGQIYDEVHRLTQETKINIVVK